MHQNMALIRFRFLIPCSVAPGSNSRGGFTSQCMGILWRSIRKSPFWIHALCMTHDDTTYLTQRLTEACTSFSRRKRFFKSPYACSTITRVPLSLLLNLISDRLKFSVLENGVSSHSESLNAASPIM